MFNGLSQLKKGLSKGAIHGLNGGLMQGLNSGLNPRTKKTPIPFRIVIDKSKCGASNSTDFPFLFSFSDKFFSNIAYGGRMFNRNGYDILFYSDAAMSVPLSWEIEYYDATTGTGIIWIKTNITYQVDTYIYGKIGVPSINTFQSVATSVWNSNYKGVWHLPNGTTLGVLDSTSNANNGTNNGATAATGKIDGGAGLVAASSQFIDTVDIASLDNAGAISVFAWIKETALAVNEGIVVKWDYQTQGNFAIQTGALVAGYLSVFIATSLADTGAGCRVDTSAAVLTANTWHHVGFVFDGSQTGNANRLKIYVDGQSVGVTQGIGNVPATTIAGSTATVKIGKFGGILTRYFNGVMDEVIVLNAPLSADWALTQYNNQSSPSTFFQIQIIK
jgi:hypothetical protein